MRRRPRRCCASCRAGWARCWAPAGTPTQTTRTASTAATASARPACCSPPCWAACATRRPAPARRHAARCTPHMPSICPVWSVQQQAVAGRPVRCVPLGWAACTVQRAAAAHRRARRRSWLLRFCTACLQQASSCRAGGGAGDHAGVERTTGAARAAAAAAAAPPGAARGAQHAGLAGRADGACAATDLPAAAGRLGGVCAGGRAGLPLLAGSRRRPAPATQFMALCV